MAQFILQMDDRGLKKFFLDYEKANAIAITQTLSSQAGLTRKNAIKKIKGDMTLRNTWTLRQIQFDQAEKTSVTSKAFRAVARAGATKLAPYMAKQELGAVKPGSTAIGQAAARTSESTRKPIAAKFRLNKPKMKAGNMVTGPYRRPGASSKSRGVAMMWVAFQKKKYIKSKGRIFQVTSASTGPPRFETKLLYSTGHMNVRIKPSPWLLPATKKPVADGGNIYFSKLKKQLIKEGFPPQLISKGR